MGETANKIASIITQGATDAVFDEARLSESVKIDQAIKNIKSSLEMAHTAILARQKAKPLYDILSSYCREDAISLIDKFVRKYEKFINATTPITNRCVIYTQNPYADKSDDYIQADIKFSVLILYSAEIVEEGTKTLVSKIFKETFNALK